MTPSLRDALGRILDIKLKCLERHGFFVGPRDPRVNTDFGGEYMVIESLDEITSPTKDGSNGPWAVVGDDIDHLINEGFEYLVSCHL